MKWYIHTDPAPRAGFFIACVLGCPEWAGLFAEVGDGRMIQVWNKS